MNYIVFDLEWNQCPYGKARENKHLPFEIIEIGAVKLSEKKEILDTWHGYIRPSVYRQLHYRTRQVIQLSINDLQSGKPFPEACREFLSFCGEDFRFCTWGTGDVTELLRNMDFYGLGKLLPGIPFYEDVQKLFALHFAKKKDQKSLSFAMDYLHLRPEGESHHALDDAWNTARVMRLLPDKLIQERFSVDYYRMPQDRSEEIRIRFPDYSKWISAPYPDREALLADPRVREVRCFLCGRSAKKVLSAFSSGHKNYTALGRCREHGYVKAKIRIKSAPDGGCFAVKTEKMIPEATAKKFFEKASAANPQKRRQETDAVS